MLFWCLAPVLCAGGLRGNTGVNSTREELRKARNVSRHAVASGAQRGFIGVRNLPENSRRQGSHGAAGRRDNGAASGQQKVSKRPILDNSLDNRQMAGPE